jgi:diguanylate cyclase (GGDEF)-like protein/PAS domain S-box-containing protein
MHARILIVDDRSTNLRIYSQFVHMMGPNYSAVCFNSAAEALAWLETEAADLMVIDYRMPEIDGAEFIRRVRARSSETHAPAIIITAHQDRECRINALDAGATDFLQSPVSHIEFRERAELLLSQHRKNLELQAHVGHSVVDFDVITNDIIVDPAKTMLEQIIDTTPILINAIDRNGKYLFLNSYQCALMGIDQEKIVGKSINDILDSGLAERETRRNQLILGSGQPIPNYEENYCSGGVELTFHCNKSPLLNKDGQTIGVLTTGLDITARKFAEQHRTHLALHDMLTGLPNRSLLAEKMRAAISKCKETKCMSALLLLDLDRFKIINDTRGHQAGDLLLRKVAERLTDSLQTNDFAARIGGDEFAIILNDVNDIDDINGFCVRLLKLLSHPFEVDGVDQLIGASIGIALIAVDGNSADELLRLADLAMYEAKANGRNCYCYFSPELNQIAQFNASVEADLREALNEEQFFLEYQPISDTQSGQLVGLEALLRWQHPIRGRQMPNEFIRIANDSGLIDRIGQWVIGAACKQISSFMAEGIDVPHIAVNISPRQFEAPAMCDQILNQIKQFAIPNGKLTIEITEELLLNQSQTVHDQLAKLRENGVEISIDDFGTGYSSLQYLRDLPATRLKIDRTFVARIEESAIDRAIISTIAHLAHALNMRVVAEGVESKEQYDLLRASGCDEVQGYYLGRPLAVDQLRKLLIDGPVCLNQAKQ